MKSRDLRKPSRKSGNQKKLAKKLKRELREDLIYLQEKILKQEEDINTLRKERSQLNSSEDHDAE